MRFGHHADPRVLQEPGRALPELRAEASAPKASGDGALLAVGEALAEAEAEAVTVASPTATPAQILDAVRVRSSTVFPQGLIERERPSGMQIEASRKGGSPVHGRLPRSGSGAPAAVVQLQDSQPHTEALART